MNRLATATVVVALVAGLVAPVAVAAGSDRAGSGGGVVAGAEDPGPGTGSPGGATLAGGDREPSLAITDVDREVEAPAVGERQRFTVTVRNDGTTPVEVRNVSIVPEEDLEYRGALASRSGFGVLEPGETLSVDLYHRFGEPGVKTLQARVRGVQRGHDGPGDPERLDVRRTFTMEVSELREPSVEFDAGTLRTGVDNRLRVTVTNGGSTPIENVRLELGGDVTVTGVATGSAGSIGPGESETFAFNVTAEEPGERTVGVSVKYDAVDGRTRTIQRRTRVAFAEPELPDLEIEVTALERSGETVTVEGRIGNVGGVDAEGVTVEIAETEGVSPATPKGRHIVGALEADETERFSLNATVDPDVETLVLSVRYGTDGVRATDEREVGPVPANETRQTDGDESGIPLALPAVLLGGLVLVAAAGVAGIAWYASGSDDDGAAPAPGGGTDAGAGAARREGSTEAGGNRPVGDDRATRPGSPDPPGSPREPGPDARAPDRRHQPDAGTPERRHQPDAEAPDRRRPDPGTPERRRQPADGAGAHRGRGDAADGPTRRRASDRSGGSARRDDAGPGRGASDGGAAERRPRTDRSGRAAGDERRDDGGGGGSAGNAAGGGAPSEGRTARCDGCGDAFAPDQLGSIAVGAGETARACQSCQKEALAAAKRRLGARRDRDASGEADGGTPEAGGGATCDGCGERVAASELAAMTLPDGSSSTACADCRESALRAARRALTGGDG